MSLSTFFGKAWTRVLTCSMKILAGLKAGIKCSGIWTTLPRLILRPTLAARFFIMKEPKTKIGFFYKYLSSKFYLTEIPVENKKTILLHWFFWRSHAKDTMKIIRTGSYGMCKSSHEMKVNSQ